MKLLNKLRALLNRTPADFKNEPKEVFIVDPNIDRDLHDGGVT